jgi:chemotaxis protein MotB
MALKHKKSQQKGAPPWLVTMGDMNNLLMCFFIVMMGDITTVNKEEFQMMLSSFKGGLGIFEGGNTVAKGRLSEMGHNLMSLPSNEKGKVLAQVRKKAVEAFKPEIQSKKIRVREDERGLVITLSGDSYFDTGSANIKEELKPVLKKVSEITKNIKHYTRIEGHTDNRPIPPSGVKQGYSTNWDLSASRSVNVLKYLTEKESVPSRQLSAVAFGDTRPIDDNNTPEGRAYNRRVEIIILRDKMLEPAKTKGIARPLPDEEWR